MVTGILASEEARIRDLSFWTGSLTIEPLEGGLTNRNFRATDDKGAFVVRLGTDIPIHGVMRFNEQAASRAAFNAGISPEVIYSGEGIMVSRFLIGRTLTPDDVRSPQQLERIVGLIRRSHRTVGLHHRGPVLAFWVFQVIRSYVNLLRERPCRIAHRLNELQSHGDRLEEEADPISIVFSHNDLLAANILDDGARLWLLDWDYAGLNTPIFDLANLSSNNALTTEQDRQILSLYFDGEVDDRKLRSFKAMKCASLLREALWSAVSEQYSAIDFDYAAYTEDYLDRFSAALDGDQGASVG